MTWNQDESLRIPSVSPAGDGEERLSRTPLELTCLIDRTRPLDQNLRARVIGQEKPISSMVCSFARLMAELRDPARPLLTLLLLGPTGVGKTETAKALAQTLFGSERAMTRVNCEEYAQGHEVSKLLGSPPGYVGSHIEPLLSQGRIDEPHRLLANGSHDWSTEPAPLAETMFSHEDGQFFSIILFDEIEKAHPSVWNALLGVLEDGTLTLGDNSRTDFTRSIILVTSNVGSREMSDILERRPVGFHHSVEDTASGTGSTTEVALAAARSTFPLEFLNRFDEILAYTPLETEHLERIFDKFLGDVHDRALKQAGVPLLLRVSPQAKKTIISQGTDLRFGARPLRRAMEREIVDPISRLIAAGEVRAGDVIDVETRDDRLAFYRAPRTRQQGVLA